MNSLSDAEFLYNAKIKSGKYDNYTKEQLAMLYADCVKQAMVAEEYNRRISEKYGVKWSLKMLREIWIK